MPSDIATAALSALDDGEKLAAQLLAEKNAPERIAAICAAAEQLARERLAQDLTSGSIGQIQQDLA